MHRGVVLATAVWAAVATMAAPAGAEVPVLHLDGRGFGHGVGLAQWGARYAADAGADTGTILATFYPGTSVGESGGNVRVAVHAAPSATLAFPGGGEIRSPLVGEQDEGFPVAVAPGGSVSIRPDGGGFTVDGVMAAQATSSPVVVASEDAEGCIPLLGPCPPDGDGGGGGDCTLGCPAPPTTAPPAPVDPVPPAEPPPSEPAPTEPPATPPPASAAHTSGTVWAVPAGDGVTQVTARDRSYRGVLQAVPDPAGLRLVNDLDVETYLKGMAEVPTSWPAAAQEAQAIAARTWVLRAMASSGEVCDHERCQVYVGATREAPAQSAAVDATRGVVLTYGGALASTVYSADAGGITATPAEGFGTDPSAYPYLTTVQYATPDPLPWVVDVGFGDVAARFGYPGAVHDVRVSQTGPSGRAMQVTLIGDAGERSVDGREFARRLGLRSTLFTASLGAAAVVPVAPPPLADDSMALPDDVAALTAAVAGTGAVERTSAPLGASPRLPTHLSVDDLASNPVTLAALTAVGVATAFGMARLGGLELLLARFGAAALPMATVGKDGGDARARHRRLRVRGLLRRAGAPPRRPRGRRPRP